MLLNWKHWTDSAAIFVNFATYHGTILLSHRIFGQTLRGFLPNSPLFSNLPLLKRSFLTFHRILTKLMANFRHACSSPHSPSYYFSSYCWQNFVKFAIFVVVWISGHRCLWAQNLATLEQVVYLFCLLFSNLPHYTNPLNTRKKIEINKLLCPGNLNKTRGLYNIRFSHKRDKKRKSQSLR